MAKSFLSVSGIYRLTCTKNGRFYIGLAQNVLRRWAGHKGLLRKGIHGTREMQRDWDAYGELAFSIEVLEVVEGRDLLRAREIFWQDQTYNGLQYNKVRGNGGREKLPPGQRKDCVIAVRVNAEEMRLARAGMEVLSERLGRQLTFSEYVHMAVEWYCRPTRDDLRTP